MASNIRTDIPAPPLSYTRDIRRNFEIIKQEIEQLQSFIDAGAFADSPVFTGTLSGVNADFSGTLNVEGALTVGAGKLAKLMTLEDALSITATVALLNFIGHCLYITDKLIWIAGVLSNGTGGGITSTTAVLRIDGKTLSTAGVQNIPCQIDNVAFEYDSAYLQAFQSGANIILSLNVSEGGAGATTPNGAFVRFNGFILLQ